MNIEIFVHIGKFVYISYICINIYRIYRNDYLIIKIVFEIMLLFQIFKFGAYGSVF